MLLHDFLKNANLSALLIAFANAKPCEQGFVIESAYKPSKYSPQVLSQAIFEQNNRLLNTFSGLDFILNGKKHQFIITADTDNDEFFRQIYKQIQLTRLQNAISDDEFSCLIIACFFALCGSPDFKLNFYSLDLPRQIVSRAYLDMLFKLLTNLTDLRQLNLNFRELQEQYTTGENERNTQFRINLRYFYDNCANLLAKINDYKYQILTHNKATILSKNTAQDSKTFVDRLFFYKNHVLHQSKTDNEIEQLRKELGFIYDEIIDKPIKRNQGISQYARIILDDECMACKGDYPILSRTFKYRHSDRLYLEVHHVISFSSDRTLDQIDNLVKLCPACHRALTLNRADEQYQKQLIRNILKNSPSTQDFCLNFTDKHNSVQFIYDRLR